MDQQLPLSEMSVSYGALGLNDQACNECKRRKGRCDRQLPECGPCQKNRRHCLYERHSKTPLTRKYLTSVEERLRLMERRAHIAEARLKQVTAGGEASTTARQSPEPLPSLPSAATEFSDALSIEEKSRRMDRELVASAEVIDTAGLRGVHEVTSADWQTIDQGFSVDNAEYSTGNYAIAYGDDQVVSAHDLEAPPSDMDDFSWDEQSASERPDSRHAPHVDSDDDPVTDGMASLSVEDKGAGYLGVASGAAMLRLLLPDAEHRRPLRNALTSRVKASRAAQNEVSKDFGWVPTPVWHDRGISQIDLDGAIDSYFSLYHLSYPIIHEPTFRAQYSQVIERPSGRSWNALAYMVGAIGLFTTSTGQEARDLDLFEAAKANISIESLESGNLTLVQVLVLMSNYLQKRNKPNSGYNYLGLALHMAMGLGLHKEFHNWHIAPLAMENRRRLWWGLQVFAVGAMITFGRPLSWPSSGIEVALPLNIDDRDLTNVSNALPSPRDGLTNYSAVARQARFHIASKDIYSKVISMAFPSAAELLRLDDLHIESWRMVWHDENQHVNPRFRLSWSIMDWRFRNFRIIMYRPFVIRHVLRQRTSTNFAAIDQATQAAIDRCLHEASATIASVKDYWMTGEHNRMSAWYALYFLFQASLIPCVCLRNDPMSYQASEWREQIHTVLGILDAMQEVNSSSKECREVIVKLCADFVFTEQAVGTQAQSAVEESPQTQLSGVYSMMWPSVNPSDMDFKMTDDTWSAFLNEIDSTSPLVQDDYSTGPT